MALTDKQKKTAGSRGGIVAESVTKSDSLNLSVEEAKLYIGTGGDLKVDTTDGQTITLKNVANGTFLDFILVKKVHSRGTTASDIVAIY